MTDITPLQGEQQLQIMTVVWRLGQGTVQQIRDALPDANRSSYNTVQTLLNRLEERGLVQRDNQQHRLHYAPSVSETDYLLHAIEHIMRGASRQTRTAALARVIGSGKG